MLTRAKKYCVLCAENKALRYAISHSGVKTKQTFLRGILEKELLN
jgi:ATP-dependent exoDNAse (exonuclease V) alpha subunit